MIFIAFFINVGGDTRQTTPERNDLRRLVQQWYHENPI